MAWKADFLISLAIIVASSVIAPVALGTSYIVGDEKGWALDVDYQAWAKSKTFYEDDKLIFKYDNKSHNVHIVDEKQFKFCEGSGTPVLSSGNDTVNLPIAGRTWYIDGVGRHCKDRKMHMAIDVLSAPPRPPPSSSPPPPTANSVVVSTDHFAWVMASIIILVCHHWTY
ncbi:hypothetical protein Leryth_018357 [Lithospermum erythrorhizon]|nr:hypothetical protein Leryth_018357 [Lithospermum erythrorhizon]